MAWSDDGQSILSGDLSGEVRAWTLYGKSILLPMPIATKPTTLALVTPALRPARPLARKPIVVASKPVRPDATAAPADDLEGVLASAREAAAAAERTVAGLAKLAGARSRSAEPASISPQTVAALILANAALVSLRSAMAAEPGNPGLSRAIEQTERAIKLLERKRDRPDSPNP